MIHPDDAARIMQEVRNFYAAGVKSGNKVYVNSARERVPLDDPFDGKWQRWSTAMLANKASIRNNDADLAQQNRPARPSRGVESFYDFGRRIYNGGKRAEFTSGNCMEMAAVSAAIAIDDYHFAPDWLYIAMVTAPGDHAFCLLSMRKPGWTTPATMVKGSATAAAFVIDPWLHTACPADSYWSAAQARVDKWTRDGKRIAWGGVDGKALGWYVPNASYAAAFGGSPLRFLPATQTL